jgi:hypothetical protein
VAGKNIHEHKHGHFGARICRSLGSYPSQPSIKGV